MQRRAVSDERIVIAYRRDEHGMGRSRPGLLKERRERSSQPEKYACVGIGLRRENDEDRALPRRERREIAHELLKWLIERRLECGIGQDNEVSEARNGLFGSGEHRLDARVHDAALENVRDRGIDHRAPETVTEHDEPAASRGAPVQVLLKAV